MAAEKLKLVVPKGRLKDKVEALLASIGIELTFSYRSYRPVCSDPAVEVKLLKPQNIPLLLAMGRHDAGFTGHDWVLEQGLADSPDITEVMDLGLNPVRIVAAAPEALVASGGLTERKIVVATEYMTLAAQYVARKGYDATLIKSFGATEAMPPEDADMIVDNTSTGSTLVMNRLAIVDTLLHSTTRLMASTAAVNHPAKGEKLRQMRMLIASVMEADKRVLLEMNIPADKIESLVAALPSMRAPTVSPLHHNAGFAVKVAVPTRDVAALIPQLVTLGATDILQYRLEKIMP